jgi:hypothetical protein
MRRCWNGAAKLSNRRQHLSTMPEGNANFFEICIRQMRKDRYVDIVLSKCCRVPF